MTRRITRVLDASSLEALFAGHPDLLTLLQRAEAGEVLLLLPAPAVAEAEAQLKAGASGWEFLFLTPGVLTLPLTEHIAVAIGTGAGEIDIRHVVYEAAAVRGIVVTRAPGRYTGHRVPLLVV